MRPFQEFRYWAKRAPAGERVATTVAVAIVVALLAWLVVPEGDDSTEVGAALAGTPVADASQGTAPASGAPAADGSTATTAAGGGPVAGAAPGGGAVTSGSAGAGSATASSTDGASAASAEGGCVSPPGKAKGITDKEVRVAIVLTELIGPVANSIFDIPEPEVAKADFEAAIAGINKEGGIACRKLVGHYLRANPADESQMMGICRQIADGEFFAAIDTGSMATRPAVLACFGQRKVPYFGAYYITDKARRDFYPYLYSFYYKEEVYKNTAFALRDIGFYKTGFNKLGFVYRSCEKEASDAFRGWIRESGIPDDKVKEYSLGCPSLFANESDIAQMTLAFESDNVTHITGANIQGDLNRITAHFEQQSYRPKWGLPDEAMLSIAEGPRSPNPDNFADAIAITLSRDAEQNTPGLTPTAGTQKCNAYRQAAKLAPVYDVPANAGNACSQLWMLDGALSNAPEISPAGLQVGLQRTKSVDFSFPQAPNDFTGPQVTTGGQFWRVAQFKRPDCSCWRIIQPEFRRGF